jgi:hypothetical protein
VLGASAFLVEAMPCREDDLHSARLFRLLESRHDMREVGARQRLSKMVVGVGSPTIEQVESILHADKKLLAVGGKCDLVRSSQARRQLYGQNKIP